MIVCHCNVIARSEIEEVVHSFLAEDAWQLVTVGMVYQAMAKTGKCCGCFPNAIALIVEAVEEWHRLRETPDADVISIVSWTRSALEHQDQIRRTLGAKNAHKRVA